MVSGKAKGHQQGCCVLPSFCPFWQVGSPSKGQESPVASPSHPEPSQTQRPAPTSAVNGDGMLSAALVLFFPRGCLDGCMTRHTQRHLDPDAQHSLPVLLSFTSSLGKGEGSAKKCLYRQCQLQKAPPLRRATLSHAGTEGHPTTTLCSAVSTSAHAHRSESCTKGRPSTVLASAANSSTTWSFGKIQGSKSCH